MAAMTQPKGKLHTAKDLERLDAQGFRYELIGGELREMSPTGGTHCNATARLTYHVQKHVYENDLGECFSAEVGVFLARNPDTVLAPDFAFIQSARMPPELPDSYLSIIPDLVFETRSPGDTKREIEEKMKRWIDAGVRLAWDIDLKSQSVAVYQADQDVKTLSIEDSLSGEDVLPGFSLPVRSIFRPSR